MIVLKQPWTYYLKQPWTYYYSANFSKRKHASRSFRIQTEADAPFAFERIVGYTLPADREQVQFTITIPKFSQFPVPSQDVFPLVPHALLEAGSFLDCIASLKPGVDIGRRKPRFVVELRGYKIFSESATSEDGRP